ncbi:MAG: homoserine kinase [Frankiaceae bacterium]|nr:homoserine kinase [Frankiaceae bacterium]MDQ1698386.1 homoserine kinase [Frankiaceae bacterium]
MPKLKPTFRAAPVRVRVPATSANLGPGFDCLGLALTLYDDVVVRATDEPGLSVDVAGMGAASVARNARNLVVRAMRTTFQQLGGAPRGLEVVCANRIPHSRGLGSSAAAIVAGVVAARAMVVGGNERMDDDAVLALATSLEGHPDNVAACLRGGLTAAWNADGTAGAVDLEVDPSLAPTVFVPGASSSTKAARKLLPESVPHADASTNAARVALLVAALARRPDLLLLATEDRLHQHYRAPAMPRTAALVDELRAAGVPAVVSGAGPTVLALTSAVQRKELMDAPTRRGWSALALDVDRDGAMTLPLARAETETAE